MTSALELWKTNQGEYFDISLGQEIEGIALPVNNSKRGDLNDPFWNEPVIGELPNPPLTWLKPETQQVILDKLDLRVKIAKNYRDQLGKSTPYSSVWERVVLNLLSSRRRIMHGELR